MRRAPVVVVVVIAAAVVACAASGAAPRIVIVSGPPLQQQLTISEWPRIFAIVTALLPAPTAPRAELQARPRLWFAMFWGPGWNDYIASGKNPRALTPAEADQRGAFYPAYRGRPAVIDLPWVGRWPRIVPQQALRILARYGVPTQIR